MHAAGVHLARSDEAEGNIARIREHFGDEPGRSGDYQLLRMADWEEGIALGPDLGLSTIREVVAAKLRWVLREPGSGAQQCLDEVLHEPGSRRSRRHCTRALDHRGVAEAIRGENADAGVCLRIASEEAGLRFLSVRQEAYEICFPDPLLHDPRGQALLTVVRSSTYRRLLSDLPGYNAMHTGDTRSVRIRAR